MRTALLLASVVGLLLAGMAAGAAGCLGAKEFHCASNDQCIQASAQGTCGPAGFCAFDDGDCESGQRYGDLSGPFSNQCVPPPDAPAPDAPDAPPDVPIDTPPPIDARECFGTGAYELCFTDMPPMGSITLAGTLDTDTDARCVPMPSSWTSAGQPDACMIAANTIMVTGNLAVTGSTARRPLVLVGETITIGATIDVASHRSPAVTAVGSPATQCAAFPTAPVSAADGAAGGAGGSFMRAGASGGDGDDAATDGGTAAPADSTAPTILRGGCAGQAGGTGTGAPGAPGDGGGAIYIAANTLAFTTAGIINASGSSASGPAGGTNAGGSGGGSGGMIVLYSAVAIQANGARLLANGGGGSAGADGGNAGNPGNDPVPTTPSSPAAGGIGAGGNGGAGFAGTTDAIAGTAANGAKETGGGGGGGGGYILSNQALTGAVTSPAATIVP